MNYSPKAVNEWIAKNPQEMRLWLEQNLTAEQTAAFEALAFPIMTAEERKKVLTEMQTILEVTGIVAVRTAVEEALASVEQEIDNAKPVVLDPTPVVLEEEIEKP